MAPDKSIWFRLGHAFESARLASSTRSARPRALVPLSERRALEREPDDHPATLPATEELIAAGALFLLDRIVGRAGRGREPNLLGLLRAGLAGAGAALLVDLVRPLLAGRAELPVLDRATVEHLAGGFGQGLLYGGLVEPRTPGPALVKGALYGSVEYVANPMGGLSAVFGRHTPHGRLPVLGELLSGPTARERDYLEHVVFGIALALLYESRPSSNGILEAVERADAAVPSSDST